MSKRIAITKRLYIREIEDGDQDLVYELSQESSLFSDMPRDDEFVALYKKYNWEEANSPCTYNGMIFRKDTDEFVGKICMQFTDREVPELGIDIMNAMKNFGYGPEAIEAFCTFYWSKTGVAKIKVRISKSNSHSIHIFEKLGAEYIGSTSYVSENSLDMMRELLPDADLGELSQDSVREYILHLPMNMEWNEDAQFSE